jgi:alcohol dehydrogenase class IV
MAIEQQKPQQHLGEQTYFGEGAIHRVKNIIKNYRRILLFNDQAAFKACGAEEFFQPLIDKFPIDVISYAGKALPIEDIQQLYDKNKHTRDVDLIIATGGGTVIDLAKIYSLAYSNRLKNLDIILGNKTPGNKIDLGFIPTTAGTGSEATSFAVVYKDKKKYSVLHPTLLPKFTILDPGLLTSLPEEILNATVLDALAQGIESMWAAGGTTESREFASMAISQILAGLAESERMKKLTALQLGAHFSGKAINISKTTLSHAISYPLTAHFGIPHGIAVFLTLPKIADLNYHADVTTLQQSLSPEQLRDRFLTLFSLFEVTDIAGLTGKLKDIMEKLQVKSRWRDYGLKKEDLAKIAENSYTKDRSDNNPRKISKETILHLLGEIF